MRKFVLGVSAVLLCLVMMLTGLTGMFTAASEKVVYSYVVTADPVCAFSGTIRYPSESLRAESVTIFGQEKTYHTMSDGEIAFNGADSANSFDFSSGRELISVEFSVLGEYDKSEIQTEITDFYTVAQYAAGENEPFSFEVYINGKLARQGYVNLDDELQSYVVPDDLLPTEAPPPMAGDINSDGKVDKNDVDLLQQYLNRYDVTIAEDNTDVTGDGVINMKDIVLLQQYINKWDVVLK